MNCLTKQNLRSKANKWYTSGHFQEDKYWGDDGYPTQEEAIDDNEMGLELYRGLIIADRNHPGMVKRDHTYRLPTISQSVVPTDHIIRKPTSSAKMWNTFPSPTTQGRPTGTEMENNAIHVGALSMHLAKDEFDDGTSTAVEEEAGTILSNWNRRQTNPKVSNQC